MSQVVYPRGMSQWSVKDLAPPVSTGGVGLYITEACKTFDSVQVFKFSVAMLIFLPYSTVLCGVEEYCFMLFNAFLRSITDPVLPLEET